MLRPRNRTISLLAAGVACLLAMTLLAACSGDDQGEPSGAPAAPDRATETTTRVVLGQVRGRLKPPARKKLRGQVKEIVERYLDAAYGGSYPRDGFAAAFADFTPAARRRATQRAAVLTNHRHDAITAVGFASKEVRVDVVSPRGRPVGATARLRVVLKVTAGEQRTEVVKGRLLLTPSATGWQVFGFDLTREER